MYVRPYQPADRPQIRTLHGRIWAEWHQGVEPDAAPVDLERIEERYLAFWVAIQPHGNPEDLVGMVGADVPGTDAPPSLTVDRSNVVQLSLLRVSPEYRRQGIGARLCGGLIDWAYDREQEAVITNTLPENEGACALFRTVGFTEIGTSVVGHTELMWFDLPISGELPSR